MTNWLIFFGSALLAILGHLHKIRINASQLGPQFCLDYHVGIPLDIL